ncbi:MAG: hypothetical protein MZV65_34685 [Chromatiales bacterium]|nr:hypothetical protein [Chromatiales bacterium]
MSARLLTIPIALLSTLLLLQGCAPAVVVGGAATAAVVHDRRTFGSIIDDQTIEPQGRVRRSPATRSCAARHASTSPA